jgi:two-component system chemotaxis response regulator CheB
MSNQAQAPATPKSPNPIKVLVVDDSAFMRHSISQYLNENPDITIVGAARDGNEALDMIPKLEPDVITLDVEMPRMDGLTALRQIMARFPRPVVMFSSLTREGAVETIRALTLGAVDFISKPTSNVNIRSVMDEAATKILRAANAHVKPVAQTISRAAPVTATLTSPTTQPTQTSGGSVGAEKIVRSRLRSDPIVMIGTSTGGPRALNELIPALPGDLGAAIVVVQHMPVGFTRSLAERLNSVSKLRVKEAEVGDRLLVGQVLVAPGGFHMVIDDDELVALNQKPPVHGVRPAVDITMISLVQRYGKTVIGAILTGMGNDGTTGSSLLHSMGGRVIVEHESTCVVYGMPRAVVEAGAATEILPLSDIAAAIERAVKSRM